ncbi:uncharacterized protein LOC18423823 [Amborella trichopoda]|uniref:uncharacterized protein LOC18423823 n=1 Tax=Amborella trichopoda TaxID=13333 RepID=UPI0009C19B82|nr:uncharacterized protein LOC18423823 [Amborella trichopoda]|eukprot:XP_020531039.1 uncharacterized protein LOC18423823 [Amborella trichopoda]
MEGPSNLKRPRPPEEFSDSHKEDNRPRERKVRFPKGKKVKRTDGTSLVKDESGENVIGLTDPRFAAKERANRRNQIEAELLSDENTGILDDIAGAEEEYEDDGEFEEDGVQIEPFNLKLEREEGYFDSEGNYVEYRNENDIKDAWLDNIDVDGQYARKKIPQETKEVEEVKSFSSAEIAKIKRRIANLLRPGETHYKGDERKQSIESKTKTTSSYALHKREERILWICWHKLGSLVLIRTMGSNSSYLLLLSLKFVLQALRRLKGTSDTTTKRGKMSADVKAVFDQLTEDSVKLMDNGDYNVYHDKRETFEREAEGYERLGSAREGSSANDRIGSVDALETDGILSTGDELGVGSAVSASAPEDAGMPTTQVASKDDGDTFDMFGDDDETNARTNPTANDVNSTSGSTPGESLTGTENPLVSYNLEQNGSPVSEVGEGPETDYVYDESSGYYYSSSLGYYYDPVSQLFCSAATGRWYSYNGQSGAYDEIPDSESAPN